MTKILKLKFEQNSDLKENNIVDKESAWRHWKNCGIKEERPLTITNNTNIKINKINSISNICIISNSCNIYEYTQTLLLIPVFIRRKYCFY